ARKSRPVKARGDLSSISNAKGSSPAATHNIARPGVVVIAGAAGIAGGSAPANGAPVDADGNVYGNSFRPSSSELAGSFPVCGPVEVGDILATDANHPGLFCRSAIPNDPGVVGVVAGKPGLLLGSPAKGKKGGELRAPVATSGVVMLKVDAGYGPIGLNDLLVASPTPGYAMSSQSPAPGTVIGKALEPLDSGTGLIKVLVMLR
ncbi:MAG: hypothetical protein P8018_12025, partial [Acidobacteriota bacterium]